MPTFLKLKGWFAEMAVEENIIAFVQVGKLSSSCHKEVLRV